MRPFREFSSFPGELPLPKIRTKCRSRSCRSPAARFPRNLQGRPERRAPGHSSRKAAPHARASEDRAGRAAPRPLKAQGRREERPGRMAHLAGTLPPHLRSRSGADALPAAARTPRIGLEGSGRRGMGKEPLTATPGAALQVGASPEVSRDPGRPSDAPTPRTGLLSAARG